MVSEAHAVVIERNRFVGRKMARVLSSAGFQARVLEEPPADAAALDGASLVVADAFDAPLIARCLDDRPGLRALLVAAESEQLLPAAADQPRLDGLLARPSPDGGPREAELLACARNVLGGEAIPWNALLAWGATGFAYRVADSRARDVTVAAVSEFASALGAPKRVAEMLAELAHELLMNALYDAPVDGAGRPRFAHDRRQEVALAEPEAAILRCASDGARVAISVEDPFGRLERRHVFAGIARGLRGGAQDRSGGGAGLGMCVVWRAVTALLVDVAPGARTSVTGLFDLDLNLREFRGQAKTLHFPEAAR